MAKIKVEGLGTVEIPDDQTFATEETQLRIEKLLKGTPAERQKGIFGRAKQSSDEAGKSINVLGKSITKVAPMVGALEMGFDALGKAVSGASGLVAGIFESTGRFSDLNPVVDMATERFSSLVSVIPLFGGFIAGIAQGSAEILKLRLSLMDLQADTFETLALSGAKLDINFSKLITDVLNSNIALNQFNSIVAQNTDGLLAFGGSTSKALSRFTENITELTKFDSPIGLGLRTLGLGAEDIAESFADLVQSNRFNNRVLSLSNNELQEILSRRIRDERVITELTGIRADEQRAARQQLATEASFQAAIADLGPKSAVAITEFVGNLSDIDPALAQAAKEFLAFGTITSDSSGRLSALAPDVLKEVMDGVMAFKNGSTDVSGLFMDVAQSAKNFAGTTQAADLAILGFVQGGEEISNTIAQILLFGRRLETQETTLANINTKLGTTFGSLDELATNIVDTQGDQIRTIANAIIEDDKLIGDAKIQAFRDAVGRELKIDDQQTLNLIAARAGFDELVSTFQATTFDTLMNNFSGLSTAIADVTGKLNELLDGLKPISEVTDKDNQIAAAMQEFDMSEEEATNYINSMTGGSDSPVVNNFTGGRGFPGNLSMVGERGPELVRFGNMGEVLNNSTTSQIMGAAAGIVDAMASPTNASQTTTTPDRIVEPAASVNNNTSDDILKKINATLDTSNMIQSNILKETKRSKGFQY